tara:strand:- start:587 stop:991 length:405 start_codon:yes stop_codon:yes gene_type:complete
MPRKWQGGAGGIATTPHLLLQEAVARIVAADKEVVGVHALALSAWRDVMEQSGHHHKDSDVAMLDMRHTVLVGRAQQERRMSEAITLQLIARGHEVHRSASQRARSSHYMQRYAPSEAPPQGAHHVSTALHSRQ